MLILSISWRLSTTQPDGRALGCKIELRSCEIKFPLPNEPWWILKRKNNIVSTGGTDKPLLSQQQVAELSSQLVIARAHTAEAKARLDRINSVLRADAPNESFGATVTDTLKNEVVSKLRSEYLDLAARESDWSMRYGPNHLAVINLRNQMREIRNSIFDELKRLGETYKSDYAIAKQNEDGVQRELSVAVAKSQNH